MASPSTTAPWPAFRAFAQCFIPETARATEPEWRDLEGVVRAGIKNLDSGKIVQGGSTITMQLMRNLYITDPKRDIERKIMVFVRFIDLAARARHRQRFATLDNPRATALLKGLASSRVLLLRRGVWGLRTLVMMGWYTSPSVIAALGYRASPAGWEARA